MPEEKDLMANLTSELRRGTLILSVLSQLGEAKYGYALVQSLEEKGVEIDPNTLYPLLRRLEKQGLLSSEWDVGESKPRKYYRRTPMGDDIYRELKTQWEQLSFNMDRILREGAL
ncbi:lineage-specific thermal regulator protein [[Eubacterium] contortum]|uniref:Lineage-specific thermal regulator protein n=1 Tax=Faecalicatena contorta TaxID=39482 RepID=A0A174M7I0_9FIRM|nr:MULTISPECIES: helix-turn-helix transcriptional regulator [Clostridia]CUP29990.1 lineage-specific thermal regulator protein [[Eubacterium] contortum] [Faecalicatena contorta]